MNYSYFCGIDISKQHLDFCLLDASGHIVREHRCSNRPSEIAELVATLPVGDTGQVLFCAEHTGMYGYGLGKVAADQSLALWMEHPAQIKACSGVQRGKTDPADATRIAQYAQRYRDRAALVQPESRQIEQLRYLQSERVLLVADRAKYKGQLTDQHPHMDPRAYADKSDRLEAIVAVFDEQIAQIDRRIAELLQADPVLGQQNKLLQSIPGVGPRLALAMIVLTGGFTRFENPRAFCCYSGVAPFVWHSGTQTQSRGRVSHRADKRIKSLLHMGALSAVGCAGELRDYYRRKCQEGKPKMSVINAVRSKLVHRMFAVIKRGQPYQPQLAEVA